MWKQDGGVQCNPSPKARIPPHDAPVIYRTNPDGSFVPVQPGQELPTDKRCARYKLLLMSPEFGGPESRKSAVFKENGAYTNKVLARLNGAADPLAEAEKLAMNLVRNADAGHDGAARSGAEKAVTALARLRIAFGAAGDDAAKKAAAIRAFAIDFASAQASVLSAGRRRKLLQDRHRHLAPLAGPARAPRAAFAAPAPVVSRFARPRAASRFRGLSTWRLVDPSTWAQSASRVSTNQIDAAFPGFLCVRRILCRGSAPSANSA